MIFSFSKFLGLTIKTGFMMSNFEIRWWSGKTNARFASGCMWRIFWYHWWFELMTLPWRFVFWTCALFELNMRIQKLKDAMKWISPWSCLFRALSLFILSIEISDRLGPVGPRTWRSVDPWSIQWNRSNGSKWSLPYHLHQRWTSGWHHSLASQLLCHPLCRSLLIWIGCILL